eukprot:7698691-Lingulodinium_polyedra.AAC.1
MDSKVALVCPVRVRGPLLMAEDLVARSRSRGPVMYASSDSGSQINGGWMLSHAKARAVRGPYPFSRRPEGPGALEEERKIFGE